MKFFIPYNPPAKWSLLDTLFWAAIQKLPSAQYDSEGNEARESCEFAFENKDGFATLHNDGLTKQERKRLKIAEATPQEFDAEYIDALLSCDPDFFNGLRNERNSARRQQYVTLREQTKKYLKSYDEKFLKQLHIWHLKILLKLRDGEICAEGVEADQNISFIDAHAQNLETQKSYNRLFSPISPEEWIYDRVNWENSHLKTSESTFWFVRVPGKEVIAAFPPRSTKSYELDAIGDILFTKKRIPLHPPSIISGRPAEINWEAVQVKIAEIILRDKGLHKQEAVASEISHWYLNEFKQQISEKSIQARLKPYYNNSRIPRKS